jgi:hypothetical protein
VEFGDLEMADFSEEIVQRAAGAVEVAGYLDAEGLDYSEASLVVVDRVLSECGGWIGELTPVQIDGFVTEFSCYILEVGRKEFGGRYLWHEEREAPALVVGEPDFRVAMLAWDKVKGRVGGDEGDNIPFFYSGFAESARKAVPGTDVLFV